MFLGTHCSAHTRLCLCRFALVQLKGDGKLVTKENGEEDEEEEEEFNLFEGYKEQYKVGGPRGLRKELYEVGRCGQPHMTKYIVAPLAVDFRL